MLFRTIGAVHENFHKQSEVGQEFFLHLIIDANVSKTFLKRFFGMSAAGYRHGRAFTPDVVSNFITVGHGLFFSGGHGLFFRLARHCTIFFSAGARKI